VKIFGKGLRPHYRGLAAEKLLRIFIISKFPGFYIKILLAFIIKKKSNPRFLIILIKLLHNQKQNLFLFEQRVFYFAHSKYVKLCSSFQYKHPNLQFTIYVTWNIGMKYLMTRYVLQILTSLCRFLQVAGISRVGSASNKMHYMLHGPHYLCYVLRLWSSRNKGK
jgi:hypothetical protein